MHLRLNMIVKNEVANLPRCLASVAPFVRSYAVLDTGSTDGTPGLIQSFFDERGVPGRIGRAPFVDYSQARNAALDLAHEDPVHDYLLLCDADMELVVEDRERLERLEAPAYELTQSCSTLTYDNTRLVHRNLNGRYIGRTHEWLDLRGAPLTKLHGARFIDHVSGSNRGEKFERDRRLLELTLAEDPNDARAMFYLGQTLKDLELFEEAAVWYDKRAERGGFPEEAWYARYAAAVCLSKIEHPRFEREALCAFQERPWRAEPLHLLANHHRLKGQNDLAVLFAAAAARIPYPKDDTIFIEDFVYAHGPDEEISIAGFYSRDDDVRDRSRAACLDLATRRGLPSRTRADAGRNSSYHARSASECFGASTRVRSLDTTPSADDGVWSATNPSIAVVGGRLRCNLRLVNYIVGTYVCRTGDGLIRTRNLLLDLDEDLSVIGSREVHDRSGDTPHPDAKVRGLEDLRIFEWRGRLWASATTLERSPDGDRAELALLELDEQGDVRRVHVQRDVESELHQKNWAPCGRGDELLFLYRAEPAIVLRCDPVSLRTAELSRSLGSRDLGHLRGSSQLVPSASGDGWLYVAHEAHAFDDGRRYLHRLVRLDADLQITRVSDPFTFGMARIEFCCGMARVGSRLVMSFGVDDARAYLLDAEEADVMRWLEGNGTDNA